MWYLQIYVVAFEKELFDHFKQKFENASVPEGIYFE